MRDNRQMYLATKHSCLTHLHSTCLIKCQWEVCGQVICQDVLCPDCMQEGSMQAKSRVGCILPPDWTWWAMWWAGGFVFLNPAKCDPGAVPGDLGMDMGRAHPPEHCKIKACSNFPWNCESALLFPQMGLTKEGLLWEEERPGREALQGNSTGLSGRSSIEAEEAHMCGLPWEQQKPLCEASLGTAEASTYVFHGNITAP